MWIRLTVCGVTRLGYGHPDGKKGGDAIKELIGDALRNAAMRFGAALDLWHKGELHKDSPDDEAPDEAPKFDARAAADRITTSIRKTSNLDQLQALWSEEKQVIANIKEANFGAYQELEKAKDTAKASLSQRQTADSQDYAEAIDYYGADNE
jgi:hypothetical protein